jgi:hypothetical protein
VTKHKRTYSAAELAELAEGLRRLLEAIAEGDLATNAATIRRLEGACAALEALAIGEPMDIAGFRTPENSMDDENLVSAETSEAVQLDRHNDGKPFFIRLPEGYAEMTPEQKRKANLAMAREVLRQLGVEPNA